MLNKTTHPKHYQRLKQDYEYLCKTLNKYYEEKKELHTINGPNGLLQIRTKDSKKKDGTYNKLIYEDWEAKDKNMAFYLMAGFGKELFQWRSVMSMQWLKK